jgi:hypothetical protein
MAMAAPASPELSFVRNIKPLFRDEDHDNNMLGFGLDLYDYERVKDCAAKILERLADGSMPCDEAWPEDRVTLFRRWMDEGCPAWPAAGTRWLGHGACAAAEPQLASALWLAGRHEEVTSPGTRSASPAALRWRLRSPGWAWVSETARDERLRSGGGARQMSQPVATPPSRTMPSNAR